MKIVNKKVRHNYELLESMEVGIVLTGAEVKAIRSGRCNLGDAHVRVMNGELWVVNMDIPKYKFDGSDFYDATRSRKLLIKRDELYRLESKMRQGRLSVVPVSVYSSGSWIKMEIALARGKKAHEKRAVDKERALDKELLREKRKFMV